MQTISFSPYEQVAQVSNPNFSNCPVLTSRYADMTPEIVSCWELTIWERIKLLFTGRLFLHVLGNELPPIKLSQDFEHVKRINEFYKTEVNVDADFKVI